MMDAPVVEHLSKLVAGLRKRGDVDARAHAKAERQHDDDDGFGDEAAEAEGSLTADKEDTPSTPSSTSSSGSSRPRNPIRVHRAGHVKVRQWRARESTKAMYGVKHNVARKSIHPSSKGHRVQTSPVGASLGGADPFGAFQLPQNSNTDRALHHWATVFQQTRMPITPRKKWMEINLSDQTLLSVTSYCSTYHFYFIRGQRAPPSCLSQKQHAISNINNGLQKRGCLPSDYLMVAVAVMTLLECLGGDPRACMIHRKGLQRMIQTRGGLQNLGFDGAVQRTISWADTCTAILLRGKPSLKPMLIPYCGEAPIPGFSAGDLSSRLLPLTGSPDLAKAIIYIWLRLRYLTQFLALNSDEKVDECFFSDKIDFIERHLVAMLHSPSLSAGSAVAFLTAFLNASLIFIYEELRECPRWNNLCVCLSERIYSGLLMVDLGEVANHASDLLVWTLMLGRSGVIPLGEPPSQKWYAEAIGELEGGSGVMVPGATSGMGYFDIAEETQTRRKERCASETRSGVSLGRNESLDKDEAV